MSRIVSGGIQIFPESPDSIRDIAQDEIEEQSETQSTAKVAPPEPRPNPTETLRMRISRTMEDPGSSNGAQVLALSMLAVILISTVTFILESEICQAATCAESRVGHLPFQPWSTVFWIVEVVSVSIFTVEYFVRLITTLKPKRFLIDVSNIVDLIAWLPFWILGFIYGFGPETVPGATEVGGVGFVRAIRLVRVFRIFKAGKYSLGLRMFVGALKKSGQPMMILVLVVSVATIIFSSIIWLVEGPGKMVGDDELLLLGRDPFQYYCFGTIPSAFWWALTTMTTVGYGDCFPITVIGKMLSVSAMFGGIIVLALPITVLGSNFQKMVSYSMI